MSKNGLRFNSITDMPEGMQKLMRAAEGTAIGMGHGGTATPKGGGGAPARMSAVVCAPAQHAQGRANKYGNIATVVDGIRFDSKREARYYEQLKLRKAAGEVSYWLRQVPIHLPGGTRYVLDFQVFYVDARPPDYVDAKGRETKEFKIKRREVEHHYPIRILLV